MPRASTPDEMSDAELVELVAGGDDEAMSTLYRRHRDVVVRFARGMTGSLEAAVDIAQDVFVALTLDAGRYDAGRAAFTTYLYAMVRNHSRTWLRRQRRWLSFQRLASAGSPPRPADPFARLEDAELAAQVRAALQRIPARYREVMILCDLHDLSYDQTARIVGASVAAVRSRLHRGRRLLRVKLSVSGSESSGVMRPAHYVV